MKAFILIFILIMTLSGTAYSFEGIVAAWLFNEGSGDDINDSVGNNNGEIEGSLKWVDGKFGKALEFAGAGDSYVTIPHNDIMDSVPYTITAWVKLEPVGWQYIIWKNGVVWPEVHKKRHMDIWVHDADYVVAMWHNEAGVEERIDGTIIVADGTWHHVAKVYDGDTVYLYIDGQVDGEATTSGIAVNGEDPLWIGAR
ncbi:hypothetical protein GF312_15150, partial [Candidatus Poribacteria bacterium]|nr:hypothetical protein [Candidatus Poribacteria bacterium]